VNHPTLTEFCFSMIGRADIKGSKATAVVNAWLPQASCPMIFLVLAIFSSSSLLFSRPLCFQLLDFFNPLIFFNLCCCQFDVVICSLCLGTAH
ncbi:hypothetical protein K457DRAFT_78606, partial [Linnemannia elongata AG-77]